MSTHAGDARFLIVNADDFGITAGVNRGIIEAHEHGIVTSASLMVRYPAALEAAEYAKANARLSVGLHFDIAEWRYVDGEWRAFYIVADAEDAAVVREELARQLTEFHRLVGREPTHLDSHQHAHDSEPVRSVMMDAAGRLRVPLRNCTPGVAYCGAFYGQSGRGDPFPEGIGTGSLVATIEALAPGWTELACHPGYADDLESIYLHEREQEVRALCHSEVKQALQSAGVALRSFSALAAAEPA